MTKQPDPKELVKQAKDLGLTELAKLIRKVTKWEKRNVL